MKTLIGALCVMAMAGCGDGESASDAFIGTWTYNTGSTSNLDCPDNAFDNNDILSGSFQVAEGTMSDLISIPQSGDKCPAIRYDVNGKVATIQPSQTCMYTENGVMVNGAYGTGTFTLSADGKTATGSGTGSVILSGAAGSVTCSLTSSISATKAGN